MFTVCRWFRIAPLVHSCLCAGFFVMLCCGFKTIPCSMCSSVSTALSPVCPVRVTCVSFVPACIYVSMITYNRVCISGVCTAIAMSAAQRTALSWCSVCSRANCACARANCACAHSLSPSGARARTCRANCAFLVVCLC